MPKLLPAFHAKAPARLPCQSRSSCPQKPPHCERASAAVALLNAPACGIGTKGLLGMAILAQKACGVWALPKSVPYRGFLPTLPSRPNRILCQRASFAHPRGTSRRRALAAFQAEEPRAPRLSVTRCAMQAVRRCSPCRFSCREALPPRADTPSKSLAPTRPRHIRQNVPHI